MNRRERQNASVTRALAGLGGSFAFDAHDANAVNWARTHAAQLIRHIDEDAKQIVRDTITEEFIEHDLPRNSAMRIRSVIGLTPQQQARMSAFRTKIRTAQPGSVVTSGSWKYKVPKKGLDRTVLSTFMTRLADRQVRERAKVIATDQTMTATNQGQLQAWEQAKKQGVLDDSMGREWITAPDERRCPICGAAEGQIVGLNEAFVLVGGGSVMTPPAHPRCRCTQGLVNR